jgi:hypothetical protein
VAAISVVLGFCGTLLIEVPFSKLEKMLFSALLKKKDRNKVTDNVGSILSDSKQSLTSSTSPSVVGNNSTLLSSEGL